LADIVDVRGPGLELEDLKCEIATI